jgi:ABC-type polysaccharide/polyol phosphate transport system ATPase subunit
LSIASSIEVERLGKRYLLGEHTRLATLRDTLVASWRRFGGARVEDGADVLWALRDVSFRVAPGEAVGVIGRNGSGKSTLLKILARIIDPTEGRAAIRGRVAALLEVGVGFHPELTGRENVYLNGAIFGLARAEVAARFDEIAAFAEVDRFLDTPVKRYSSGMRVRLAFSVAAHLDPEILLIDEVLSVGDYGFQQKSLRRMKEVLKGGRTVLFVSHSHEAVKDLCARAIWLKDGRVEAEGPSGEVVARYLESMRESPP